jgi:large subunit ribosomal protein L15
MNLSNLKPPAGQKKKQRRVGQGMGTGRGKFSGRGAKGAKSITGYSKMRGFEGGQMPLHRRLPKRGFTNPFREEYAILNLSRLEQLEGDTFTPETLMASGVVKKLGKGLKILAHGELKRKIAVTVHAISAAAKEKIEAVGGSVQVIA